MAQLPHFGRARIKKLISMAECIDAVGQAMRDYSSGYLVQPQRRFERLGEPALGTMLGRSEKLNVYGIKVITLDPRNSGKDRPTIQGVITLFDEQHSTPVATLDAQVVTAMRTAAASAYATRLLARSRIKSHGIVGTGVQAESHARAMQAIMPNLSATRIWGRSPQKALELVAQVQNEVSHEISSASLETVCQCDVVSVVTGAHEPVVFGSMFQPGTHINLVGTHNASHREADSACIAKARVYVDSKASAQVEAGDLLIPMSEGLISQDHVLGEIGQVDLGHIAGRQTPDEVTLFKSVGIFAQDLYVAARILSAAPLA